VQGLANPGGVGRWHDYGTLGTPTVFFDAVDPVSGAANAESLYRARIESRRETPPLVTIAAELTLDAGAAHGSFAIRVDAIEGVPIPNPEECNVRAVVFEDDVFFCCGVGGRDTWDRVARALVDAGTLEPGGAARQTFAAGVALEPSWNLANLQALVFVQRGVTGEVLQAGRAAVLVTTATDAASWGRIKSRYFSK